MDKTVRDQMTRMARPYRKRQDAVESQKEELEEYAKTYFDRFDIYHDEDRINELILILPHGRARNRMTDAQYEMLSQKNDGRSLPRCREEEKAFRKLKKMAGRFEKKKHSYIKKQKKLDAFVIGYLDRNNLWDDPHELNAMIDVLPAGMLRFRLLDAYHELERKDKPVTGKA